jgi:hypothetical protein
MVWRTLLERRWSRALRQFESAEAVMRDEPVQSPVSISHVRTLRHDQAVSEWVQIPSAAVGALVAISGAFSVAVYQRRTRRQEVREAEAESNRRELVAVLAPIENLLSDLNPSGLALSFSPHSPDHLAELRTRWLGMRDQVAIAGQMHPSADVAHAIGRLGAAVGRIVVSATWFTRDRLNVRADSQISLQVARADHKAAQQILMAILDAVREGFTAFLSERIADIERTQEDAEEQLAQRLERSTE